MVSITYFQAFTLFKPFTRNIPHAMPKIVVTGRKHLFKFGQKTPKVEVQNSSASILKVKVSLLEKMYVCVFPILTKRIYVMRWAIWYHLHILKSVKNTHGGVLILVTPPWVFFMFFKLSKWYQIAQRITYTYFVLYSLSLNVGIFDKRDMKYIQSGYLMNTGFKKKLIFTL